MKLLGRHAIISGSGKRIGRALAEALLKEGMNLTAHYYSSDEEIAELVRWAQKQNLGRVLPIRADLRQPEDIARLGSLSQQELGPATLIINNASDFYPTPLETTSRDQWDRLLDLNLKAPFFLTQQFTKDMPSGSQILFIADVHGSRPIKRYAPYCASKSGIISLTKTLAKELAPKIRVNCISPGTVLPPANAMEEEVERAAGRTLLKRIGEPEDIVQGLLFLCRNEYITGFDLVIDGGRALI